MSTSHHSTATTIEVLGKCFQPVSSWNPVQEAGDVYGNTIKVLRNDTEAVLDLV